VVVARAISRLPIYLAAAGGNKQDVEVERGEVPAMSHNFSSVPAISQHFSYSQTSAVPLARDGA
jgi:hypothetical protein